MANERARQKKAERKRLKRDEKRRAARASVPVLLETPSDLPAMSATLKAFADPLLDKLQDSTSATEWKFVLGFAAMVWNAAADREDLRADEVETARRAYRSIGWDADLVEEDARLLRERKAAHFSKERRKIVGVDVVEKDGGLRVFATSAVY